MRDKGRKVNRGIIEVVETGKVPSFFMMVDADDRVHKGLAEFVNKSLSSNGWYLDTAYIYPQGGNWVYKRSDVINKNIVKCDLEDLPSSVEDRSSLYPSPHHLIKNMFEEKGRPLGRIPFPAYVYVTDSGENHSGISWSGWNGKKRFIKKVVSARPIFLPWIRRRFGNLKVCSG